MIEIEIFTDIAVEKLIALASKFRIPKENIKDGGIKLEDYSFMSNGQNYLLCSRLEGDFNLKLDVSLLDEDWTGLDEKLRCFSNGGQKFACERYDYSKQAPWDYYLYEAGKRCDIEILDGEELGSGPPSQLKIVNRRN